MSRDLAKEHPGILAELQRVFLAEAVKYKVLSLDDRRNYNRPSSKFTGTIDKVTINLK